LQPFAVALTAGTRLGPYEITAQIGVGGMGEVYRATDTDLKRTVAIKVLPESVAADAERLARFQREAEVLASLNHPNIAAIYGLERSDGTTALVMELVEGPTLADRIAQGAIPIDAALPIARQIAEALEAAHEQGIIHRDVKPANIKVRPDGTVKVLDFGLAKTLAGPAASVNLSQSPTMSVAATRAGVILGTAAYMSPEQARGKPVDKRTDIWAFGCVLYEMLTGRPAFAGDTRSDVIAAVLEREPEWRWLPEHMPPAVLTLLTRCLEKDAKRRLRDIGDARLELEEAGAGEREEPAGVSRRSPRRALWAIAGVAVLIVAAVAGFLAVTRETESPKQSLNPSFTQLTSRRGTVWSARFAPDGQTIVYAASWDHEPVQLFSTRLGNSESRPLGFSPATLLSISTRGEMALLLRPRWPFTNLRVGLLARADLAGGAPRELLQDVHGADWSPSGTELVIVRTVGGKFRLEFPIGRMLYETPGRLHHPRISPRADWIALYEASSNLSRLIVISPDGKRKVLSEGWENWSRGMAWSPNGDEVWFTGARSGEALKLYAVSLDGEERVVADVPESLELFDIGHDGRVLLAHSLQRRVTMGLRPGTREEHVLSWLDLSFLHDLAADGTAILFDDLEGPRFRRTDGSPPIRLARAESWVSWGTLSPDGRWVLTKLSRSPDAPLMIIPTGVGESRPLAGLRDVGWAGWLPRGRVAYVIRTASGDRLYAHDPTTGGSQAIASRPSNSLSDGENGPRISPDGRWIAASTGNDISIFPVEGGALRLVPGNHNGWTLIGWSADGAWLYAYRIGDVPAQVVRINIATGERQPWKEMAPVDRAGLWRIHPIRVTPDGRAYAYTYTRYLSSLYLAEGLQ
jgi:serine/threonine protein kinase